MNDINNLEDTADKAENNSELMIAPEPNLPTQVLPLADSPQSVLEEDAILNSKMASGVGRRNQTAPDHEADASRITVAMDKVGRWLGFQAHSEDEELIEVASIGKDKVLVRPSSITVRQAGGAVTVYRDGSSPQEKPGLGRGGWTAVGLLLVFLPLLAVLGLLAFNLEQSLEAQQLENFHFQRQEDPSLQTLLAEAINDPQVITIKMKSLEGLPTPGAITLFQPPASNWLLTFRDLNKLEQGQVYVAWFAKQHTVVPTQDTSNYMYLADFNGNITRSGVTQISYGNLYGKDQRAADYTEMIVTVESANQKNFKQPSAPIYFVATLPSKHF